ncbi:MAG: hypothetical protein BRC23_01680 [Parcubacteria group bacterium SW_4_49_11]|nr:MAG: hypothetical protein BRC23_01680 [Parcubacteria group bacterium SW_4_49_11]
MIYSGYTVVLSGYKVTSIPSIYHGHLKNMWCFLRLSIESLFSKRLPIAILFLALSSYYEENRLCLPLFKEEGPRRGMEFS